ncbi:hypothetical protein LTR08_004279 [Meristemomyces frigidus]|nr:hypothetical protein LTR08_004279 [Meristemomyces frigidus]
MSSTTASPSTMSSTTALTSTKSTTKAPPGMASSIDAPPRPFDDRCHILSIPPELRLRIYGYYFGDVKTCHVAWWDHFVVIRWPERKDDGGNNNRSNNDRKSNKKKKKKSNNKNRSNINNRKLGLLYTCSLIYDEALPELHAACKLDLDCDLLLLVTYFAEAEVRSAAHIRNSGQGLERTLDGTTQCGFLASIADVRISFNCTESRDDVGVLTELFTTLRQCSNVKRLHLTFSGFPKDVEMTVEFVEALSRALSSLTCGGIDMLFKNVDHDTEKGWSRKAQRLALLAAANA